MDSAICHVVIVGCGLGGLAAAIALRRQGHEVTMLEQAAQLSEVPKIYKFHFLMTSSGRF